MSDKHTPGPWLIMGPSDGQQKAIDDGGDYAIYVESKDGQHGIIAEAYHRLDYGTFANAKANARLIAAAPEMYEALMTLIKELEDYGDIGWYDEPNADGVGGFIRRAKAAIAKAENET